MASAIWNSTEWSLKIWAVKEKKKVSHLIYSLTVRGHWGNTEDLTTTFLHFPLFSTAFLDLANSRPVHSLMLSSRLFLCLPCLLPPLTLPCKMVLARTDEWVTWPYHCSFKNSYIWNVFIGVCVNTCSFKYTSGKCPITIGPLHAVWPGHLRLHTSSLDMSVILQQ